MPLTHQIGNHIISFIADDCIHLTLKGVLEPQQVHALVDLELACAEKHGYVIIAVDASSFTGLPAETRREVSQLLPKLKGIVGLGVVYGTSNTVRVLIGMLFSAMRVLASEKSKFHYLFVASQKEALRSIEGARTQFQARSR